MPTDHLAPVLSPSKPVDLDKLDSAQIGNSFRFDAEASGKRALAMLQHVDGLRRERAMKATLAGIYLSQVRIALPHGEFEAWAAQHLGKSVRTARNYMQLAAKFSRSAKLLLPEIIGANQLTLDLEAQDNDGRAILAKLDRFVGECGLTELMHRHQVIKQGGARPPAAPALGAGDAPAGPAPTTEEAEAAARDAVAAALTAAEKTLLAEITWHDLTLDAAERADALLRDLAAKFHERLLRHRHEHAA
jgi:hypothetical protein